MTINSKKTKDMWICFNTAIPAPEPLVIGNEIVERVNSHKLLGVWHQNNLKWNCHVKNIVRKANKRMFSLRECRRANLPPEANLMITLERTFRGFPWLFPATVKEEIRIEFKDQSSRSWFTKLWEVLFEEVDEVMTNATEKKEERLEKIEGKLNALSRKYEIGEKKIEEQLNKIQTMLEKMESNIQPAVQSNQCKDTRK
ncbi:Hypothetical predicted protein [Paramuricea clavata]|uniref:Uncharacterized protein n=1 Tax=Paramuricea clavata TaxID=317549 RepID=A0A6S7H6K7_PARCT|nr:Hypothetical predicted protein [Paramuricea clavata]